MDSLPNEDESASTDSVHIQDEIARGREAFSKHVRQGSKEALQGWLVIVECLHRIREYRDPDTGTTLAGDKFLAAAKYIGIKSRSDAFDLVRLYPYIDQIWAKCDHDQAAAEAKGLGYEYPGWRKAFQPFKPPKPVKETQPDAPSPATPDIAAKALEDLEKAKAELKKEQDRVFDLDTRINNQTRLLSEWHSERQSLFAAIREAKTLEDFQELKRTWLKRLPQEAPASTDKAVPKRKTRMPAGTFIVIGGREINKKRVNSQKFQLQRNADVNWLCDKIENDEIDMEDLRVQTRDSKTVDPSLFRAVENELERRKNPPKDDDEDSSTKPTTPETPKGTMFVEIAQHKIWLRKPRAMTKADYETNRKRDIAWLVNAHEKNILTLEGLEKIEQAGLKPEFYAQLEFIRKTRQRPAE